MAALEGETVKIQEWYDLPDILYSKLKKMNLLLQGDVSQQLTGYCFGG